MSRPITITLQGGVMLDTDKDTRLGLKYTGGLLGIKNGGSVRSYDLSVPATTTNDKILNYSELPETDGLRQSFPAELRAGGVAYTGRVYLKRWVSRRYELLFVASSIATDWRLDEPIDRFFRPADSIYCEADEELDKGTIPQFGFYAYNNRWNNGQIGTQQMPPTEYPCTNLGYLIDGTATSMGYGINWHTAGGPYDNPYNYGILLPSMSPVTTHTFSVTGNAISGFSPSGATLTPYGLHYVTKRFKRGLFGANKTCYVFEALQPCRVHIDNVGTNYIVKGTGKDILAEPTECLDIELDTGEYFSIVNASDKENGWVSWWWNGSTGYSTNIDPVTMEVLVETSVPTSGSTIYLRYLLPKMSLAELLDAYCLLACATWRVENGNIEVWTFGERLQHAALYADLDTFKVGGVSSVVRYVEGFADHNLLCCTPNEEWLPDDVAAGSYPSVFWRDYRGGNDYLSDVEQYGVVPFHDGWYGEGDGTRYAYFEDVEVAADGTYIYQGRLSIFFANLNNVGDGNALHISVIDSEGGIGQPFGEFVGQAVTANVDVVATLDWFAGLQPVSVCRWRGRDWIVREAAWGDGIAQLELVRLPVEVEGAQPEPPTPPIPAEYQEVEYIESQGDQWIDTGQCLTMDLKWYLKVQWTNLINNNPQGFGAEQWGGLPLTIARIYQRRGNSTQGFVFGDTGNFANYSIAPDNLVHEVEVENGTQMYDGVIVSNGVLTHDGTSPADTLLLFAVHGNGAVQYKCENTRLYSSIMWRNGVKIREFVPVVRILDTKPGLYDTVNNVFYTNAGSGEFLYA